MMLITSCNFSNDDKTLNKNKKILAKIEKAYDKYEGYQCKSNIRVISEEVESIYLIEETYSKPSKYRLEVLKPEESKGIIIMNTDDKVFVEHPSINQSISLTTIRSLNNQMLVGEFFEGLTNIDGLSTEDIEDKEYFVFQFSLEEKNKYRDSAKIWIDKKSYTPHKLNIFDSNDNLQIEITYEDFEFTEN